MIHGSQIMDLRVRSLQIQLVDPFRKKNPKMLIS